MSRYFETFAELSGKTAVVTVASSGIGAGIAKVLAADGAAVVINCASNKEEWASRLVSEIRSKGGKAINVEGDIEKAADVERIFAETKQTFGQLDILVNNSSIFALSPFDRTMEEDLHRYFKLNALGLLLTTQEAINLFGPEGGSIFHIDCVVSDFSLRNSNYTATKIAVDAVTQALAKDLSNKKISITSIEVVVQLLDRDLELPPKREEINFFEDRLAEGLSNTIRIGALRSESGRIRIKARTQSKPMREHGEVSTSQAEELLGPLIRGQVV